MAKQLVGPNGPAYPDPSTNEPGVFVWDEFLNDPTRIERAITAIPAGYFIGETLLNPIPNPTGVVLYNQLIDTDLFPDVDVQLQPGVVPPGAEYPEITFGESGLGITSTKNRGAKFYIYDRERDQDRRQVLNRRMTRFANRMRQIHNARVIAAIMTDPTVLAQCTTNAAKVWSDPTAKGTSELRSLAWDIDAGNDLAYETSWVGIHPDALEALFNQDQVQNFSPRENASLNPLFRRSLTGLAGIDNWNVNRGWPRTAVVLGSGSDAGFLAVRRPFFVKTEREEELERQKIWGGREEEPVIDQPFAIRVLTGVLS